MVKTTKNMVSFYLWELTEEGEFSPKACLNKMLSFMDIAGFLGLGSPNFIPSLFPFSSLSSASLGFSPSGPCSNIPTATQSSVTPQTS
jgi:hypothetical protein